MEFKEGKLTFSLEKEYDKDKSDDEVTMKVINDITNSIDKMITMTYDKQDQWSQGTCKSI